MYNPEGFLDDCFFSTDRRQCVGEPWEDFRWSSEEEQQQQVPVQAAASRWEGAGLVGTFSFFEPRQLQQSHAAGSGNERSPGVPAPLVQPGRRPAGRQPQSRGEHQWRLRQKEVLPRRAAVVVCVCWLDTGDRNQRCVGLFHHDVRAYVRERPLYKLAYLHGGILLWEFVYHSTSEGEQHYSYSIRAHSDNMYRIANVEKVIHKLSIPVNVKPFLLKKLLQYLYIYQSIIQTSFK